MVAPVKVDVGRVLAQGLITLIAARVELNKLVDLNIGHEVHIL